MKDEVSIEETSMASALGTAMFSTTGLGGTTYVPDEQGTIPPSKVSDFRSGCSWVPDS